MANPAEALPPIPKPRKAHDPRLDIYCIVLALFALTMLYMTGIHNIDNGWNMRYVEMSFGVQGQLIDESLAGLQVTPDGAYVSGLMQSLVAFVAVTVVSFMLGRRMYRDG